MVFRYRRSYYARRRVVIRTLCFGLKIVTFQLTAHIGLLKEGGKISPKKLSRADTKFNKAVSCYRLFWCDQSIVILTFFEGGLLCVEN